jgi:flagellar motility protein MotE (MotC chaperone)
VVGGMIMSMANELYRKMNEYCAENKCQNYKTAKEWNEVLGTNYASATFTALANSGRVEKYKNSRDKVYSYEVVLYGKYKEVVEEEEAKREKEWAERVIAEYDNNIAEIEAHFEAEMKRLEERKKDRIAWANLALENAKKKIEG